MTKIWIKIAIITGLYLIFSIITTLITRDILAIFLGWNMVLSTVVLFLGYLMKSKKVQQLKKGWFILLSFVWLLFFPNALYFITDFIHISRYDYFVQVGYLSYQYIQDIAAYFAIAHIFVGVIISLGYGYVSLCMMNSAFEERFQMKTKQYLILSVLFLSSIGIGIGRFLRFNSWDIFRPIQLIGSLFSNLSWFLVEFILLFFILQVFLFYAIHLFRNKN